LSILLFCSYCALSSYLSSTYSSYDYLRRLAGVSELGTFAETRTAILQQLPAGTPKATIIAYLEARNIPEDRFEGGQLMRYQQKDNAYKVLVLLSDPPFPWKINIACSHVGYVVHFNLDSQRRLIDVAINSTAICL
jgi:hypothetical protein